MIQAAETQEKQTQKTCPSQDEHKTIKHWFSRLVQRPAMEW